METTLSVVEQVMTTLMAAMVETSLLVEQVMTGLTAEQAPISAMQNLKSAVMSQIQHHLLLLLYLKTYQ